MIIYTNETCPFCAQVKQELEKQNIKFLYRLTSEYPDAWNSVVSLTGMPTVPTVVYEDNIYVPGRDFNDVQSLVNRLKSYKKSPYSELKHILEKTKSLNYNINVAFTRLDKLLKQIENKIK